MEVSRELPQCSILNTLPVVRIFGCYFLQLPAPGCWTPQLTFWYQVILTLFVTLILCVSLSNLRRFLLCSKLATPSSVHPFFCPTVASNSYSSWDECPSNLRTLPTFSELANMTHDDLTSLVAAPAAAQVKLCPYNEEEPHIWFRLIETQFAAAGIKSQKLNRSLFRRRKGLHWLLSWLFSATAPRVFCFVRWRKWNKYDIMFSYCMRVCTVQYSISTILTNFFFNRTYCLFLNTVQYYNILISILLFCNTNI